MIDGLKEAVSGAVNQGINDALAGIGLKLTQFLLGTSHWIALVGGGILIILYVAGYRNGMRYTGVLFVGHMLVRYLLG